MDVVANSITRAWTLATGIMLAGVFSLASSGFAGAPRRVAELAAAQPAPSIMATSARLEARGDLTRLSFALSQAAPIHAFLLADPDRVIVDLPEINFQVDPMAGRRPSAPAVRKRRGKSSTGVGALAAPLAGIVNSYRFGLFAPGKSRIVVDRAEPARVSRAVVEQGADGVQRLILDLVRTDRASFMTAAAKAPPPPMSLPTPEPAAAAGDRPVIVLDAGHGGVDDGAHGAGTAMD